jgi:hypothetical protein
MLNVRCTVEQQRCDAHMYSKHCELSLLQVFCKCSCPAHFRKLRSYTVMYYELDSCSTTPCGSRQLKI